jgi:L-histidine N-alpha-methyltransferase
MNHNNGSAPKEFIIPKNKINDLIFKEMIKRGYSLFGKTRVWNIADSKLWYLTPAQAQAFLDLEKSQDYQKDVIQKEIDLINTHVDRVYSKLTGNTVNIIDIGCGDGKKAVLFIDKLNKEHVKIRYCPIDISNYMVERAINNIRKLDIEEVIEFKWNISDFENLENVASLIRLERPGNNLYLLLGNTLGNFEINELLYQIRSSMVGGEILIIGNGLSGITTPDDILKAYDNPFLDELLSKTLTQIGFNKGEINYGARFANGRVEMYYTVNSDVKIGFLDKKVYFNKGDQIIVAVSYKYNADDFKSLLNLYFDDVEVYTSEDKSYALTICKK